MTITRRRLVQAGVLAALVAGAVWLVRNTEWVDLEIETFPRNEAARDRYYAAKSLVRKLGGVVVARDNLDRLPPVTATLMLSSSHWNMFPDRDAALRHWVESGGRLVLVDMPLLRERSVPGWTTLRAARTAAEAASAASAARAADGAAPRFPFVRSPPSCILLSEPDTVQPMFVRPRSYRVCGGSATHLRSKSAAQWSLDDLQGVQMERVAVGKGSVALSALFDAFTNQNIVRDDGSLAFAALLDLHDSDEVWFVEDESRAPLLRALWAGGKAAVLLGLAALVLALWRGMPRFGPLAAEPGAARRSIGEQIRRTAAFIAAGPGDALQRAALQALDAAASRTVADYASLQTPGSRAGAIASRIGTDAAALEAAMRPPSNRRALPAALALIERTRRALLAGRRHATPSRTAPTDTMSTTLPHELAETGQRIQLLRDEIGKAMVGQREAIDQLLITLIASGHALIEGVPGLGKTLLARALAKAVALRYARIQFTPDMLPSDITGHAVLDAAGSGAGGSVSLRVRRGPVFTNILLADEINRAPAKTQSALLEVMQEYQVSLEGETLHLERPFIVLATQNPIDTDGTYPLPEAQLDRFLCKIEIGYPPEDEEVAIVVRTTQDRAGDQLPLGGVVECIDAAQLLAMQQLASRVHVDARVVDYAVRIVRATRGGLGLAAGSGPRGAIALIRAARAAALLEARDFVTPDDVKRCVLPVLRHRVMLAPDAQLEGRRVDELLSALLETVVAPRL